MKATRLKRNLSSISSARWGSYFAAATATAISGAHSVSGEIHYSGLVNVKFRETQGGVFKHTFPLSQGAFLSGARDAFGRGNSSATFEIAGAAVSNAFRVVLHTFYSSSPAAALPRGAVISQGDFGFGRGISVGRMQDAYGDFPGWQAPGIYYIGFRFDDGAGKQYGWVRIKWGGYTGVGGGQNEYVVKDYAWGDPGDKIKAGQTTLKGEDAAVLAAPAHERALPAANSEGSLGLLALGAVGLQAWRHKRRYAVAKN